MKTQSVDRALDILLLFSMQRPSYVLNEIATLTGLNKSTAWRLTTTLEERGLLEQEPETRRYRLGRGIYQLGMIYANCLEINNKASMSVHSLAGRMSFTTRIGIWDRNAVIVTMVVIPQGQDSLASQIGPRIPAYCTALGKVMLAFLEHDELKRYLSETELIPYTPSTITSREQLIEELKETRQRGYSISKNELIPGVMGIAAPIFGRDGSLVAAISLGVGRLNDLLVDRMNELSGELLNTALEISRQLGFGPEAMKEQGIRLRESIIRPDLR